MEVGKDPFKSDPLAHHADGEDIYAELRRLAHLMMQKQPPGHTLQATALVHEAWLKLNQYNETINDQHHLLALGSRAIRQVLTDHARKKQAIKRAGDRQRISFDGNMMKENPGDADPYDLIALDEALNELATCSERPAQVIELRFFGGLTMSEIADVLHTSKKTVENDWAFARAWLRRQLTEENNS